MARVQYKCRKCKVSHFAGSKVGRRHRKFEVKVKKAKKRVAKRRPAKRRKPAKRRAKRKPARRKKRR